MSGGSWDEFEAKRIGATGNPAAQVDNEFDILAAQTFTNGPGAALLKLLRHRYIETGGNPMAVEAALRVRVAQQQFVLDLERAMARGTQALQVKARG